MSTIRLSLLVLICSLPHGRPGIAPLGKISPYIRHYEGLSYSSTDLHNQHVRAKRALGDSDVVVNFRAHNKDFTLNLRQRTSAFMKQAELELGDGSVVPLDVSHIYEGVLQGSPGSRVRGSIIDGVFGGVVQTSEETYHVERADAYFSQPQPFHSIMYRNSHINIHPHKEKRIKRSAKQDFCGIDHADVMQWMKQQKAAVVRPPDNTLHKSPPSSTPDELWDNMNESENAPHLKYAPHKHRQKRAPLQNGMCNLYMRADTMLWERYTGKGKLQLGYSQERAEKEITSLFHDMVSATTAIYEEAEFKNAQNTINYSGINFKIHRIKINKTSESCIDGANTKGNPLCNPNLDVHNFLNYNSLQNNDDFCLAYTITFRDFDQGTLGLAWTGDPGEAPGGICDKYQKYSSVSNAVVWKGLNTGIVSLINYNVPVPPKVSTLTFAHEVGHNFGSPHDFPAHCQPYTANGDPSGNFLMYSSATTGDELNNNRFSSCSLSNISHVLDSVIKGRFGKKNCFKESEGSFCGNQVTEPGEECDCGYASDCSNDPCCTPKGLQRECMRQQGKFCSPSEGPCCKSTCDFRTLSDNYTCASATDCKEASTCNGAATCPAQRNKPNNSTCNEDTQICKHGECGGSVCEKINWEECSRDRSNTPAELICFVSCKNPTTNECVSTGDTNAMDKVANKALKDLVTRTGRTSLKLQSGTPCDNLKGYCDVFSKCRLVDANGILNKLGKFFGKDNLDDIKDWILEYWWVILIAGIGFIVLMGIFISVCAVHTPSNNPNKKPARKVGSKKKKVPTATLR